jgi:hypothetical protein
LNIGCQKAPIQFAGWRIGHAGTTIFTIRDLRGAGQRLWNWTSSKELILTTSIGQMGASHISTTGEQLGGANAPPNINSHHSDAENRSNSSVRMIAEIRPFFQRRLRIASCELLPHRNANPAYSP